MAGKAYLTIEDVAKRFGITTSTAYRLAQGGELPGFKIGGQWRFSEALLDSWVVDQVTIKQLKADEHLRQHDGRHPHDTA